MDNFLLRSVDVRIGLLAFKLLAVETGEPVN